MSFLFRSPEKRAAALIARSGELMRERQKVVAGLRLIFAMIRKSGKLNAVKKAQKRLVEAEKEYRAFVERKTRNALMAIERIDRTLAEMTTAFDKQRPPSMNRAGLARLASNSKNTLQLLRAEKRQILNRATNSGSNRMPMNLSWMQRNEEDDE
jgi:endonuclease YncB( thermonuclease family)